MTAVSAFAAATLLASAAYAGSPYYDTDGQAAPPVTRSHTRVPAMKRTPSLVSPRAPAQYKSEIDQPSMASDGFATPETDREVYEHAEGTMPTPDTGGAAPGTVARPGTAALPPMAPDGFERSQSDNSFFEHAVGTDGSQVVGAAAPAAPKADPVYTAAMPKMDADGFEHPEGASSFYNHALGTDGAP